MSSYNTPHLFCEMSELEFIMLFILKLEFIFCHKYSLIAYHISMDYRNFSTTTQYLEDPFPRVSAGFTITSLFGNIRTHIFPPWHTFRVIACRLASICLDVIHMGSSA